MIAQKLKTFIHITTVRPSGTNTSRTGALITCDDRSTVPSGGDLAEIIYGYSCKVVAKLGTQLLDCIVALDEFDLPLLVVVRLRGLDSDFDP
jgi:hypothetical protein